MPVDSGVCPSFLGVVSCNDAPPVSTSPHVSFMGILHRECAHVLTVVFLSGMGQTSTDSHPPPVRLLGPQRFMRGAVSFNLFRGADGCHCDCLMPTLLRCSPCSSCPRTVCRLCHGTDMSVTSAQMLPVIGTCHTALVPVCPFGRTSSCCVVLRVFRAGP